MDNVLNMDTSFRWLLLFIDLYLLLSSANATADTEPLDEEIKKKCNFSLNEIQDCKHRACMETNLQCQKLKNDQDTVESCQIDECMKGKKRCEKVLNRYLTDEQICEGDEFSNVDGYCMKSHRKSLKDLIECKTTGYLDAKKTCFKLDYKGRIQKQAMKEFNKKTCDEALQCTLDNCFEDVQQCLRNYHEKLSMDPGKYRHFELSHCAYIAVDYPHECETFTSTSCSKELKECNGKCALSSLGIGVGVVILVILAIIILAGIAVWCARRRRHRSPAT